MNYLLRLFIVGVSFASITALGLANGFQGIRYLLNKGWPEWWRTSREILIYWFGGPGGSWALPLHRRWARHRSPNVRRAAAHGIGRIGNPNAVPALAALLDDESPIVIGEAAIALARLGDWRGLRHELTDVRASVADELQRVKATPNTASDEAWLAVAQRRFDDAGALGEVAVEPLRRHLEDPKARERGGAARALATIADPTIAPLLHRFLRDGDPGVQGRSPQSKTRWPDAAPNMSGWLRGQ